MRILYVISFEALKIIPDTLQELKIVYYCCRQKKRMISLINPIKDFAIVNNHKSRETLHSPRAKKPRRRQFVSSCMREFWQTSSKGYLVNFNVLINATLGILFQKILCLRF